MLHRLGSLIFIGCIFSGCAMPASKVAPKSATEKSTTLLNQAEKQIAAGKRSEALVNLEKIVQLDPMSDLADDAGLLAGRIQYEQQKYEQALKHFLSVIHADTKSPRETEAIYWAALALYKLGRYDESLNIALKARDYDGVEDETKNKLQLLRFRILHELGDKLQALQSLVTAAQNSKTPSEAEKYKLQAQEYLDSQLSVDEVKSVANSSSYSFLRAPSMFFLGRYFFEQHEYSKARDYFSDAIQMDPTSQRSDYANNYLVQIDARRIVDPKTIGVVLPLTGKQAPIAYKVLHGIQLGLGLYGRHPSEFRLAVIDSEGNADTARRGVEKLVTEDHAIAIIGSLLSKTASAVAGKANDLGVPSIGLSQKSGLTESGDLVFRNALTTEMQVRHLVQNAMDKFGYRRFAVLFPDDPYGQEYAHLFWDEVLKRGGTIQGAQPYSPDETDFRAPIQRLVGTYYVSDRQKEYKARLKEWEAKRSARSDNPDGLLPPIVDFDAIFIPDNTRAVGQIAPMLAYNDVDNVALLGTNLWNSNSLIDRGKRFVEGALFVDGVLIGDSEYLKRPFVQEFSHVFSGEKTPGIFEIQGYDSALILRTLIAGGATTREELGAQLRLVKGLTGAVGPLNMSEKREIERPVLALKVEKGQFQKLEDSKLQ